jgi:MFS family permease
VLWLLGITEMIQGADAAVPLLLALGTVALAAFGWWEARCPSPLIDLALIRNRVFAYGNAALFLNALARGALLFLLTFAFQGLDGNSPLVAGMKMLPLTVAIMVVGPIAGRLSDRIGSRELSVGGLLVTALSLIILAESRLGGGYAAVGVGLFLAGLGNGLFNSPNTSAVMGSVAPDRRGVAAGTRTLLFNTGQLFSLAVSFAILASIMGQTNLARFVAGLDVAPSAGGHQAFQVGLSETLLISAGLSLAAAALAAVRVVGRPARASAV